MIHGLLIVGGVLAAVAAIAGIVVIVGWFILTAQEFNGH